MIKVSRILTAQIFYRGTSKDRSYRGTHLYLTPDPTYAAVYSKGGPVEVYEIISPMSKIFTLKKVRDLDNLREAMTDDLAWKSIVSASRNGELDWAAYHSIGNEEFDDASRLLSSLGYDGVWLSERPGVKSVLIFDGSNDRKKGEVPAKR